ncbi:MAG: hypothetical protein WKF92_12835 [Pyrinomonadaceae bacterium]
MSNVEAVKTYNIAFQHRPAYLYAHVEGKRYSYEIVMQCFGEILRECQAGNFDQVLIEEEIPEINSMVDIFRAASELPQLGFTNISIAFVDRFPDQKDLNNFGRLAAVNRGIDGQIFDNVADADIWLSERDG